MSIAVRFLFAADRDRRLHLRTQGVSIRPRRCARGSTTDRSGVAGAARSRRRRSLPRVRTKLAPSCAGIAAEPPSAIAAAKPAAGREGSTRRAESRGGVADAAAAAASRARLRGTHRHPLGGLDRRADAGARRLLHGPLLDRGGTARPARAHAARRPFALALLAAGEWTRRKESVSAIVALPIANIPAILTAAGTAVAFATVYAAYALYGFLAPATAFILLGTGGAGHARRCAAAWTGIGRARRRRRLCHAATGVFGASPISGRSMSISQSSPLRRFGAGAHQPVALAGGHDHRVRVAVDPALPGLRALDGRVRTPSTSSRASSSQACWWCAACCSVPRRARSGRADLVRLARRLSVRRDC